MGKTPVNNGFKDWSDQICNLSKEGQSIGIGVFTTDGTILKANPAMCFFLNADPKELKPKNLFINPEFKTFIQNQKEDLVFEGLITIGNYTDVSFVLQSKVYRKGAQILIYSEVNVPELIEENNKMSALNQEVNNLQRQLIREKKNLQNTLSELRETQQMLIHSEKMNAMGKLVAGVAHELNNPIAFVYSNIFQLEKNMDEVFQAYIEAEDLIENSADQKLISDINELRKKNDLEFLKEDITDMVKESKMGIERVKTIVEDLRRFSRLDESEIKRIDLIENIKSTISIARSEITRKNIQFEFSGPPQLQVDCFPGQLNQAILNVLMNAIYAVEQNGHITLTVKEEGNQFNILVSDDGSGIPEEIRNRVFDPFFTTKPVGAGTGLGLSITYRIITDLHHGSIQLESEAGKGTTFTISIPQNIA